MTLDTDFSDKKKTFVSYPVFLIINGCNGSVSFGTLCVYAVWTLYLLIYIHDPTTISRYNKQYWKNHNYCYYFNDATSILRSNEYSRSIYIKTDICIRKIARGKNSHVWKKYVSRKKYKIRKKVIRRNGRINYVKI